jgi:hypothetical protein
MLSTERGIPENLRDKWGAREANIAVGVEF